MNQLLLKILVVMLMFSALSVVSISIAQTSSQVDNKLANVPPAEVIWQKIFGGAADDRAFYAVPAGDGYLVVGSTKSIVPDTIVGWALRLDGNGDAIWNRTYLEGSGTELRYVINITDGFLLVGNEFLASGGINGMVVKIDNQGAILWNTTIGNENQTDRFYSATAVPDGFVVYGLTSSNGGAETSAWIVKLDLGGHVVWNRAYAGLGNAVLRAGALAPGGDYVVAGYVNPSPQVSSDFHFLLMKIDAAGNLVWNETYWEAGSQEAHALAAASNGYVIVGDSQSPGTNIHAWVVKVDFNGTMLWAKTVGGSEADSPSCIAPSGDGGYLVGGFTFSWGAGNRDFWLFKINDSGQVLWSCTLGDEGYQEAYSVIEAGKNQYVMVGWTDPPGQPTLIGKATYDFLVAEVTYPQGGGDPSFLLISYVFGMVGILLATLLLVFRLHKKRMNHK